MKQAILVRMGKLHIAVFCLMSLCACTALRPAIAPHTKFYSLDSPKNITSAAITSDAPAMTINPPRAAAGFDSPRLIYVREAHKLEYFANSAWAEPPAHMLAPLLFAAIANTGAFSAVVHKPGATAGDLRLDTEVIRLQQDFRTSPSQVRFTLRAHLVDSKTRRIVAWQEFDATANAPSEDPYGGVIAANNVVQDVLGKVAIFCAESARGR